MEAKPMPLLLIEDEAGDRVKFVDCANRRGDVHFVGMTGSSEEGFQCLQSRLPEGVILDLQLTKGEGSGLAFLDKLNAAEMPFRPVVVVTTTNQSPYVKDQIEKSGVDWIFCKKQKGYNADFVIDTLLKLRGSLFSVKHEGVPGEVRSVESPEERRKRIVERIDTEMNLIGLRARYRGRLYLHEAIFFQIEAQNNSSGSAIEHVAVKHKHSYSTVTKVMQTAINNAWDSAPIEELKVHYTAKIDIKTGVPSPTDFIHSYADKIRKSI